METQTVRFISASIRLCSVVGYYQIIQGQSFHKTILVGWGIFLNILAHGIFFPNTIQAKLVLASVLKPMGFTAGNF